MGDRDNLVPEPPDKGAILRRDDPEHLTLLTDVKDVKSDMGELKTLFGDLVKTVTRLVESSEDNERRVMGHFDKTSGKWRDGLFQGQEKLDAKIDALTEAIKKSGEDQAAAAKIESEKSAERVTGAIKWVGGIISTVIVGAATAYITVMINQHANTISTIQGHMLK